MPSAVRTPLRAPSAATTYSARSGRPPQVRDDPVGVLGEAGERGAEPHVGARVPGGRAQDRFEHVLRDEAGRLRPHLRYRPAGWLPQRQPPGLRERPADRHVVVAGEVARGLVHGRGEAELAEDLHAPEVQPPRLGLR